MTSNKVNRTYTQYLVSNDAYSSIGSFVQQLGKSSDDSLIQQTIQEIRLVLSQDYPPLSKVFAIRLIKELFLLTKENIIAAIQNKILPQVCAVALYKDNQKGATFFSQTNFYQAGDEKQKQTFKSLGVDYVLYCKDSLSAWALLIPFANSGNPSRFAQKYADLKNKGVLFPKQRYLYKQSDKQIFQKVYKVQFFNQDSSLSQSLLNLSNCDVVIGRQLHQQQQLEQALKSQLQAEEQDTDWRKVKTIIERLNIFFHESSVKMLQELKDLNMPAEYTKKVLQSQSRCGQLIQDYQYYKSNKIAYSAFYNAYGYKHLTPKKIPKLEKSNVSPQQPFFLPASPQVKMKKDKNSSFDYPTHEPIQLGKKTKKSQTKVLKQQNSQISQKQQQNQQRMFQGKLTGIEDFYKQRIEQQKQNAQLRVNEMKKLINQKSNISQQDILKRMQEQSNPLRDKIQQLYEDLKDSEIQIQKLKSVNKQLQSQLSESQRQYAEKDKALKKILQETERYKDMANNYQQKIQYLQKQASKQPSVRYVQVTNSKRGSEVDETSNKKLQKKIQNLTQEKEMLKQQLNHERGKNYQNMSYQTKFLKDEIQRLKNRIKDKQLKQRQQLLKIDNIQVQNIKLKQELKVKSTISQSLKKQNEWITKTLNQMNSTTALKKPDEVLSMTKSIPHSTNNKLNVKDYLEIGLEGSTYYDVLPKQFRIKYKRSCFKKKELLYKQYNIEIGVITELKDSNNLNETVFLTNYGTKDLHNIRIKILNPTSNQIQADSNYIDRLKQGEQHKVYVDAIMLYYPIGPVVLKLQYSDDQMQNTVQLLLPVSIIKLVRAYTRHNPHIEQHKRIQFKYDHKMIQNPSVFKDYFPQVQFKVEQATVLRMTLVHDHTKTQWNMDIELDHDYIELRWGQVSTGFEEIQQYYCKTLRNLLTK